MRPPCRNPFAEKWTRCARQGFGAGLPDRLIARISAGSSAVSPSLRRCKEDSDRLKAPADWVKICERDGKLLHPGWEDDLAGFTHKGAAFASSLAHGAARLTLTLLK